MCACIHQFHCVVSVMHFAYILTRMLACVCSPAYTTLFIRILNFWIFYRTYNTHPSVWVKILHIIRAHIFTAHFNHKCCHTLSLLTCETAEKTLAAYHLAAGTMQWDASRTITID